jgi:hypothetical protein
MNLIGTIFKRSWVLAGDVFAVRHGPVPVAAMLRGGFAVDASFLTFVLAGHSEAAVIAAVFTNLLCLADRALTLSGRLWVQIVGATLMAAGGAVGTLINGNDPLILVTTFAFALFAGFVHGTLPGVEAVPRFAIVCFIAASYLPLNSPGTLAAVLAGSAYAIAAVRIDDYLRNGRRGARIARINAAVSYPGPRFSIAYGAAAVCGLAIGLFWGQSRPYWVTITTLVVMQPDRRASMVRALQRFIGTILGVVLASVVARALPLPIRADGLIVFAIVLPFVWPLGFERNYGLGVAILSFWVLLLIDFALPPTDLVVPVFLARLSNTAIGCAVALAGGLVVFETREPDVAA